MTTTLQQEFDWLLATNRPLLCVAEAARLLHDCSERHVIDLIDEGRLRAYNLASSVEQEAGRRLVRVLRADALRLALAGESTAAARPLNVPIAEWLPVQRPSLHAVEIARWFGVARNTVVSWDLKGPKSDNRSIFYTTALVTFLQSREITPA
jgi:hypothetical protein